MMLWKCHTHYVRLFGKLSSGHRTGKGRFSFQSQRKTVHKNVQTTKQLLSFHMPAKYCSKFSKPGFNSTWIENFQMFKLVLEKAEEPEINCQHPLDHGKSKRVPEKHLFLLYWLHQSLWLCVRESFPRQVDKESRGPQGEKGLEFSRRKKGQTFFSFSTFLRFI